MEAYVLTLTLCSLKISNYKIQTPNPTNKKFTKHQQLTYPNNQREKTYHYAEKPQYHPTSKHAHTKNNKQNQRKQTKNDSKTLTLQKHTVKTIQMIPKTTTLTQNNFTHNKKHFHNADKTV